MRLVLVLNMLSSLNKDIIIIIIIIETSNATNIVFAIFSTLREISKRKLQGSEKNI